jgi:hypothetical protein
LPFLWLEGIQGIYWDFDIWQIQLNHWEKEIIHQQLKLNCMIQYVHHSIVHIYYALHTVFSSSPLPFDSAGLANLADQQPFVLLLGLKGIRPTTHHMGNGLSPSPHLRQYFLIQIHHHHNLFPLVLFQWPFPFHHHHGEGEKKILII